MMRRTLTVLACAVLATVAATRADANTNVALNGTVISKASSTIDSTQDVLELREGGNPNVRLLPGLKRFGVCVISPGPIAALDAELPLDDTPSRFTVRVEDSREFGQCLLASLKAEGSGGKRRLTYCLRCENVTAP
jgi:hypothetical protein